MVLEGLGGYAIFGGYDETSITSEIAWLDLYQAGSPFWEVTIENLYVNTTSLILNTTTVIFDSAISLYGLPSEVYSDVCSVFNEYYNLSMDCESEQLTF